MSGPGTSSGRAGSGPGDGAGGIGAMGPGGGGSGTGPGGAASGRPVEDRLRRAFAARAESIAVRDLRPAAPPGPHSRRSRLPGPQRPWLRRFGLPLAAAAATVAVVIGYLATAPGTPPDRPVPATPPSPVAPTPTPTHTGPTPDPSPSRPSADPDRTAGSRAPGTDPARPPHHSRSDTPTPRPTDQPDGRPSATALPPSTTPSHAPTPQGSAGAGDSGNSPSPTHS
ncbi:hypothetical protein ACGFWI_03045 [Streptomyces sp. NPDC048434]|uniref:hypothetical protein n=1 Tax=Streptomyces sp. NPDC048434 TaxID=3365549 RepID=UPI003718291F